MSKGDKRRPVFDKRIADVNWEIFDGGWALVALDPPGTSPFEFKNFYNCNDPSEYRVYWRPLKEQGDG